MKQKQPNSTQTKPTQTKYNHFVLTKYKNCKNSDARGVIRATGKCQYGFNSRLNMCLSCTPGVDILMPYRPKFMYPQAQLKAAAVWETQYRRFDSTRSSRCKNGSKRRSAKEMDTEGYEKKPKIRREKTRTRNFVPATILGPVLGMIRKKRKKKLQSNDLTLMARRFEDDAYISTHLSEVLDAQSYLFALDEPFLPVPESERIYNSLGERKNTTASLSDRDVYRGIGFISPPLAPLERDNLEDALSSTVQDVDLPVPLAPPPRRGMVSTQIPGDGPPALAVPTRLISAQVPTPEASSSVKKKKPVKRVYAQF